MTSKVEVVQQALAAVVTGDSGAADAVIESDFVWHIPGHSVIGGRAVGAGAWGAKLQRLFAAGLKPEIVATLEGDSHVAVLQRNVAESGDLALDVKVVNLFTIRDGKVSQLETFFSDQHAVEAFWNTVLAEPIEFEAP